MEKNIYDIIQDWHELLNQGIISESEFNVKKHELLNSKQIIEQGNNSTIIELSNKEKKTSIHKTNNQKSKNQNLILVILGLAFISLITFYIFKLYSVNHESDDYYVAQLEDHLIKKWEILKEKPIDLEDRVTKIYLEDGNLRIDSENSFLSVYNLSEATVLKGDLNNDNTPEVIVNVDNSGGGAGGNLSINENYILTKEDSDNYKIQQLDWTLLNPPKNEYGYQYVIEDINDGLVNIKLKFFRENDYHLFPEGKELKLKCRLIGTQLKIIY